MMASPYKKIIVACLLCALIVAIYASNVLQYITLNQLKIHRLFLQEVVASHYFLAVITFIDSYIIFAACALPAAAILTVAGGFLFGTFWGALYTNIGATIGATGAFLVVRYLIGNSFQERYAQRLTAFNASMNRYGSLYLLSIHFVILIPFFIINILAALTNISLWTFVWTTAVGIIPGSLMYAFAGSQLMHVESLRDIFSWKIIATIFILICVSLLPLYMQKIRGNKRENGV
jgi:uncharacterized membrane protein YdjX (TVP38/TMEM64 family)